MMNCQEFEKLAAELACDHVWLDALKRRSALAHAMACAACARRLADERELNAMLGALAESTEHEAAPPHLKQTLLAAFDQIGHERSHTFAPPATPVAPMTKVVPIAARLWPRWALAAAATILIVAAIAIAFRALNSDHERQPMIGGTPPAPAQTPVQPEPKPEMTPPQPNRERAVAQAETGANPKRRPARRQSEAEASALEHSAGGGQTSDFIPLTYLTDEKALQNGLLVRVEMPRSALIALGMPLNAARNDANVKADVVLGDNGVAYAIRVVH